MKRDVIIIGKDNNVRAIYSPKTQTILDALGSTEVKRASHVEPTSELSDTAVMALLTQRVPPLDIYPATLVATPYLLVGLRDRLPQAWWADMTPVNGPVLGPFPDRDTALATEVQWLHAQGIPTGQGPPSRIQIEPPTSPVLTEKDL